MGVVYNIVGVVYNIVGVVYNIVAIYLLKVNNRNTRTRCKICSKLTIKLPERRRRSGNFIVNFEHILHLVLVFLLLTYNNLINFREIFHVWIYSLYGLRRSGLSGVNKGNAQFIFLCNSQKSSVNVCLMKILKKLCLQKK